MIPFESTDEVCVSGSQLQVRQPVVTVRATNTYLPGWYRVRIQLETLSSPTIRKRLELKFDTTDETEIRSWNERLGVTLMMQVQQPATELQLKLVQCCGDIQVRRFQIKRISKAVVTATAVREKLRLVSAYQCLRPVLWRGAGMIARGQFRKLGQKLFRGLADGKVMRPDAYRASEADAAWWRTQALPASVAEPIRHVCDQLANPESFAIIIPVNKLNKEYTRLAAESVRRQLYPHWELFIVWDQEIGEIGEWSATDERVTHLISEAEIAVPKVKSLCRSDRVIVLPPTMELAEDALYRLKTEAPEALSVLNAVNTECGVPVLQPPLAIPFPTRQVPAIREVTLTAELNGINGYDAVVFALMKGLPEQGFRLLQPSGVKVREDLLPPHLRPRFHKRQSTDLQLLVFPPFALNRFDIDRQSIIFTMWETDQLLPAWVRVMNRSGRVIVPSEWGANCFRAAGVTVPISVVPLGYDPTIYNVAGSTPDICTFGTAGALAAGGMRKNAQHIIDLFRAAFPLENDVKLRVKLSPTSPVIEHYGDTRIDILRASLPHRELANWYRSLSAYVNGSFGEGFGLHLIEAMACGRPLITPNVTGLTQFYQPEFGYPVRSEAIPVHNDIYRGNWHQPNDDDIISAMRRVYRNPSEAQEFGRHSARIATQFTWENCCAQLAEILSQHQ